jgi:hypothetical protein
MGCVSSNWIVGCCLECVSGCSGIWDNICRLFKRGEGEMTKEHKQAHLLRYAADNEDALFKCDKVEYGCDIAWVASYPDRDWKIYTPSKPNIVTYHVFYANGYIGGSFEALECAKAVKASNVGITAYIKTTFNGETGKITVEVIEL